MFGYVTVNKQELKVRELEEYQSYYCGLCQSLKKICGVKGQLSLNYDLTFLIILLSGLYEPEEIKEARHCVVHPLKKHVMLENELFSYVADMTLLLTWYKCRDDFRDERNVGRACYAKSIETVVKRLEQQYVRQTEKVSWCMRELAMLEEEKSHDIDELSGCFGHVLEEIFVMKEDEWQNELRKLGFYMGKFIYILDAYDDLEQDRKKKCFNVFLEKEIEPEFDDYVKCLLTMAATEFAKGFERLPILKNASILRNIIYSGIWSRFEQVRAKRNKERKEDYEKSL